MPTDRRKDILTVLAIVFRLFIFVFYPQLCDILTGQVEISTPVSSFKRRTVHSMLWSKFSADGNKVQEGTFLYKRGASPYDGGVFHQVLSYGSQSIMCLLRITGFCRRLFSCQSRLSSLPITRWRPASYSRPWTLPMQSP